MIELGKSMQGLALVDYDNVCWYSKETSAEVELRTEDLVDTITHRFNSTFPELRELDIRFYGGWTDERGIPSPAASRLVQVLPALRGRRHGLIVRPSLAMAMRQCPDLLLRGTIRLRSKRKRQKMVDGMIGCDTVFVAADGVTRVGVVTNDDDLVPAVFSAHASNPGRTLWMRPRPAGEGLNDEALAQRGLCIRDYEGSTHG